MELFVFPEPGRMVLIDWKMRDSVRARLEAGDFIVWHAVLEHIVRNIPPRTEDDNE